MIERTNDADRDFEACGYKWAMETKLCSSRSIIAWNPVKQVVADHYRLPQRTVPLSLSFAAHPNRTNQNGTIKAVDHICGFDDNTHDCT